MDHLWTAPETDLYRCNKLLPASWNNKKPERPKGKGKKHLNLDRRSPKPLLHAFTGQGHLFNFENRLQRLLYFVAALPSIQCSLIPSASLTVSSNGTAVHTHAPSKRHHLFPRDFFSSNKAFQSTPRHFSDPDAS